MPGVLPACRPSPFPVRDCVWLNSPIGHEIIATIAQIHIHPSVLPVICNLLDITPSNNSEATLRRQCHLALIASWADRERMRMRWSAAMHYVGAVDDHPGAHCQFPGPRGWAGTKGNNVLDAFKNVTRILADWSGVDEHGSGGRTLSSFTTMGRTNTSARVPSRREEEAFRFLVHFVGDVHQPLHLTGRDRGGNGAKVVFEGRETNLHSVWDTRLLTRLIRTVQSNYFRPLPDRDDLPIPSWQVEMALRHAIYDPLVRRVMWQGIESKWINDIDDWLSCPAPVPAASQAKKATQSLLSLVSTAFNDPLQLPQRLADVISLAARKRVDIQPDGPLICPFAWSAPLQQLNCEYVWPTVLNLTDEALKPPPRKSTHPTLDTREYMAALDSNLVIEKLLAQGGIRLAGILNWLFAQDEA